MASTSDIVTRALRRLNIIRPNGTPSAAQAQYGLDAFNEMIDSWKGLGVDVSDDLPLDGKYEMGITALLAVRLSGDYGIEAPAQLRLDANTGWTILQAGYIVSTTADYPDGLKYLPSQRRVGAEEAD